MAQFWETVRTLVNVVSKRHVTLLQVFLRFAIRIHGL